MAQTTVAQKAAFGSSHVAPRICLRPRQAKIFVKTPSQRQIFFQSSSRQANKIAALLDINEADFETQVLKSELPVLVDFWAAWCGPCKLVAPSMVWADKEFGDKVKVVKVDCTNENKALMEKYKVYGLPCLIVFKDGAEVAGSHREGAITRKDLGKYLEEHVGIVVSV